MTGRRFNRPSSRHAFLSQSQGVAPSLVGGADDKAGEEKEEGGEGEGNEDVQAFGAEPSYQPAVSLPEQERKTGEEEERQLFAGGTGLMCFGSSHVAAGPLGTLSYVGACWLELPSCCLPLAAESSQSPCVNVLAATKDWSWALPLLSSEFGHISLSILSRCELHGQTCSQFLIR